MSIIEKFLRDLKPEELAEYVKFAKQLLGLEEIEKRLASIEETQARLASVIASLAKTPEAPTEAEQVNPGFAIPPEIFSAIAKTLLEGGKSEFDKMVDFITKARAVSDALNPPSVWDKILPQVVLRSLTRAGLLTPHESREVWSELGERERSWRKRLNQSA